MRKEKISVEEESFSDRVIRYVATLENADFAVLTVTSLAERFFIDRFKMLRIFKAEKGMKLESFLLQEKMYRCAFILTSDKDITVKELSRLMGYCTSNYFIQVFRKYFGVVPGDYKEFKARWSGMEERRMNPNGPLPKEGDRRKGHRRIPVAVEIMETGRLAGSRKSEGPVEKREKKEVENAKIY